MKKLVFLTGAGMSKESGINTFRDSDGLWENYPVEDVATIEGYYRNKQLVLDFYNNMRAGLESKQPNEGHRLIHELEDKFEVSVITQNIDNLHERAGSTKVVHLHGELTKACNEDKDVVEEIGYRPIKMGEQIAGQQSRPFIVWFGEGVPEMSKAMKLVQEADIFVIIGTSMVVYPAAGLIDYVSPNVPIYLIDPADVKVPMYSNIKHIKKGASEGMKELCQLLK